MTNQELQAQRHKDYAARLALTGAALHEACAQEHQEREQAAARNVAGLAEALKKPAFAKAYKAAQGRAQRHAAAIEVARQTARQRVDLSQPAPPEPKAKKGDQHVAPRGPQAGEAKAPGTKAAEAPKA